jgi:hypothetical protein
VKYSRADIILACEFLPFSDIDLLPNRSKTTEHNYADFNTFVKYKIIFEI